MNATRSVLFILLGLTLLLVGCRREDIRECTFTIPSLTRDNQTKVSEALEKYDGIDRGSYRWNFDAKTLTLRYDSMKLAQTNIRMSIAEKGIEVDFPTNTTDRAGH